MINKRTGIPFYALLLIIGLLVGFIGYNLNGQEGKLKGISQQYEATTYSTTTGSVLYLATSTDEELWIIPISLGVDQLNLDLTITASSTAGQLVWAYEWSENRTDWFAEDIASSTSESVSVDHIATTTVKHKWLPASVSEVAKSVVISNVNANFLRINFERGVTYENMKLEAVVRSHTN